MQQIESGVVGGSLRLSPMLVFIIIVGMAKKMLLLRKQQPSKMWKLYHRMLINPYKPSGGCQYRTSDCTCLFLLTNKVNFNHKGICSTEYHFKLVTYL